MAGSVWAASAVAQPVQIVAAENVYGDIAAQIGGARVSVQSILNNPDQDPHLFEASPSVARALSNAQLVIYNGIGYDPWVDKLLAAAPASGRRVIAADKLTHASPDANPHLWYNPAVMPAVADAITRDLIALDPQGAGVYEHNHTKLAQALAQLDHEIAAIRTRHAGIAVTATEPVFNDMARALGFVMRNEALQLAIMNETEPSASQIQAFENDLRTGQVRLLFYNDQEENTFTRRVKRIAQEHHVPIVRVTETMPSNVHFQAWIGAQLSAITTQLDKPQ